LTVRQIQSVLHASARRNMQCCSSPSTPAGRGVRQHQHEQPPGSRWHRSPKEPHQKPEHTTRCSAASSRLCEQLARTHAEPAPGTSREAMLAITTQLPHIARHLDLQIRMLAGRAIARATALPIDETRVNAWLGKPRPAITRRPGRGPRHRAIPLPCPSRSRCSSKTSQFASSAERKYRRLPATT
jgi:hypothetical protein